MRETNSTFEDAPLMDADGNLSESWRRPATLENPDADAHDAVAEAMSNHRAVTMAMHEHRQEASEHYRESFPYIVIMSIYGN
jgi:hypothetical protein